MDIDGGLLTENALKRAESVDIMYSQRILAHLHKSEAIVAVYGWVLLTDKDKLSTLHQTMLVALCVVILTPDHAGDV